MAVHVHRFDIPVPSDMSGLAAALAAADHKRIRRLALFARVAGEYGGGTRELAKGAVDALLAQHGLADRTEMVTVIGTDGASSPFGYAFIDDGNVAADGPPRLAIGLARAAPPPEAGFDRAGFAVDVAAVVQRAIQDGGLLPDDVATVIVNVPEATSGNTALRGRKARAAAALGAGMAIGEIAREQITDGMLAADFEVHTRRTQSYIGPSVRNIEVIVLGNRRGAGGDLLVCSTVMNDLLDVRSVKRMLVGGGLALDALGELAEPDRVVAVIAKSGARPDGKVLGVPTTMLESAMSVDRHVRGALSGVLGAALQTTRVFSTYDPVQQAPLGGGTLCCVVRTG
jgi:cyanuric acid amidohydrolase